MKPDSIIDDLLEELSHVEHERWSRWQRHMHSSGKKLNDGSLLIPANLVARWEYQMKTPYSDLSEKEKESDREQVREYIPLIKEALRYES